MECLQSLSVPFSIVPCAFGAKQCVCVCMCVCVCIVYVCVYDVACCEYYSPSPPAGQINDVVVRDHDCCRVVPLLQELTDDVTLLVARNSLSKQNSSSTK